MAFNPYDVLTDRKLKVLPQIVFIFEDLGKTIKRKITKKQTVRNPGTVLVKVKIFHALYYEWFSAVRDYVPSVGVVVKSEKRKGSCISQQ